MPLGVAGGTEAGVIRIGTAGSQTSTYIAGIYGVTTSINGAVEVMIDSNGNLGTVSSSSQRFVRKWTVAYQVYEAVIIVIAVVSGRSPLIAHLRVGHRGRALWLLKLRTMWDSALPVLARTAGGNHCTPDGSLGHGSGWASCPSHEVLLVSRSSRRISFEALAETETFFGQFAAIVAILGRALSLRVLPLVSRI